MEMGIDSENVLLAQDGDSIILGDNSLEFSEVVPAGYLYVDGVILNLHLRNDRNDHRLSLRLSRHQLPYGASYSFGERLLINITAG